MAVRTGQLDQISESIGEIRAYVHAGRHDIANLTQIVNSLDAAQIKRHVELKAELSRQIEKALEAMRSEIAAVSDRVALLEEKTSLQAGQISVWKWMAEKWPFALVIAAVSAVVAWANGKLPL